MPDLPDFASPPLVEVVLAAQTVGPAFVAPRVGPVWSDLLARYPRLDVGSALPPIREEFGFLPGADFPGFALLGAPDSRYLLASDDERRLVQIQQDRVALNWRRVDAGDAYPRYSSLVSEFDALLASLASAPDADHSAKVDWVEVTYVNHIESAQGLALHQSPFLTLSEFQSVPIRATGLESEDFQVDRRFVITNDAKPVGRLRMHASTAIRNADARPIVVLTLTSRVESEVSGYRVAMDRAHESIVQAFGDLTAPSMHPLWGRVT